MAYYEITMNSFGSECPANWEEIADYLNDIIDGYIDELTTTDEDGMETIDEDTLRERVDALWECWCAGDLEGAPAPVGAWEDR